MEAGTRHPVADAVRDACGERHISVPEAEQAQTQPGEGASCSLDGQQVWSSARNVLKTLNPEQQCEKKKKGRCWPG